MQTQSNTATITESKLAEKLGISREILQRFRASTLNKGVDWSLEKRVVIYRPAGLILAARHLGEIPAESKKKSKKAAKIDRLKVINAPRNRRIVFAVPLNSADKNPKNSNPNKGLRTITTADLKQPLLRVRVRDNSKFLPGMEMPVRHIADDVFELTGNQPRYKGRF